jgi:hypothetical protein
MKTLLILTCSVAVSVCFSELVRAQSDAPYTEGPVWTITMVKTKHGMTDDYLKAIAKTFKGASEEAKEQGLIVDYKILLANGSSAQDYDILLMTEYKSMRALDNLREAGYCFYHGDCTGPGGAHGGDFREIVMPRRDHYLPDLVGKLMSEITLK